MKRKALVIGVLGAVLFASGVALAATVPAAKSASTTSTSTSSPTSTGTSTSPVPSPPPGPGSSTTTSTTPSGPPPSASSLPPAAQRYAVINVTVDAASDHEIAGSSAFPNFDKGAVDNYYSLAHSSVDNSPSAEGTASPADTGPLGQTAAAGNFSQPQYADSRWPGDSSQATVGNQGGPYAAANAGPFSATATSSEASNGGTGGSSGTAKSGPSGKTGHSRKTGHSGRTRHSGKRSRSGKTNAAPKTIRIAAPKGFSARLRRLLAAWKATWLPRLNLKLPAVTTPGVKLKVRSLSSAGSSPATGQPSATLPTGTLPTATVPGVTVPTVTVPTVTAPTTASGKTSAKHKKKASHHKRHKKKKGGSGSSSPPSSKGDGQALMESTTSAGFDPSGAMLATGESSLASVSIGSGQIVLQGLDTSVSVTNHGKPADKISVTIGGASIGGVPVTIDQDGVHVAGQGGALPYGQADDALNSALKQAGIQLFTVQPEIKKSKNEVAITASAVDVSFIQPVAPSGMPAQYVDHLLGEVFVDSLATPGTPPGSLGLGLTGGSTAGGGVAGGGSGLVSGGGSSGYSSSSSLGSSSGSSSYPTSGSTGSAAQAPQSFLTSLTSKPLWLLLTYFLWQAIVIGTGAALWFWRLQGAPA